MHDQWLSVINQNSTGTAEGRTAARRRRRLDQAWCSVYGSRPLGGPPSLVSDSLLVEYPRWLDPIYFVICWSSLFCALLQGQFSLTYAVLLRTINTTTGSYITGSCVKQPRLCMYVCMYDTWPCTQRPEWRNNFKAWQGTHVWRIFANNQLDALFHVFIYFISLHVSSITVLIIRRSNCTNTSSGMISLCKWLLGMPAGIPSSHLHRLIIPDDVLVQFDLLMMSTVMLETCREMK